MAGSLRARLFAAARDKWSQVEQNTRALTRLHSIESKNERTDLLAPIHYRRVPDSSLIHIAHSLQYLRLRQTLSPRLRGRHRGPDHGKPRQEEVPECGV